MFWKPLEDWAFREMQFRFFFGGVGGGGGEGGPEFRVIRFVVFRV